MFKKIQRDKWKHFIVGIGMGIFLQAAFLYAFQFALFYACLWAGGLSILIAYGFELFSLVTGKGHYELLDAVAGALGAGVGMLLVIFI